MRIRIRDPSGKSATVTLEDASTVEALRKTISTETSLTSFDVKYGYPPKSLQLDRYPATTLLSELDIKLNGEQLIVTHGESLGQKGAHQPQLSSPASTVESVKPVLSAEPSGKKSKPSPEPPRSAPSSASSISRPAAPPLSLSRKENKEMTDPPEVFLPDVGGTLVLRIMPDDNSCLFRAIASAVISDMDAVTELRSIVAQTIQAHPEKYNKAILDNKDPDTYCRWIQNQDSWGGQIELDILSQHFETEICSIDVQSLRVDRYNETAGRRCFIVYSGIHYDTIALSLHGMSPDHDVKQFEQPLSDEILPQAQALCRKLQAKHYYTDTAGFQLVCEDCGTTCVGESGATKHAQETGHYNFGEAS